MEPERLRYGRQGPVGDQRFNSERRRRSEQIAVAMMARCEHQAWDWRWPEDRGVVDRAWPEAGPHGLDRHLLDGRKGAACALKQRKKTTRRDGVVEAALLDGRADDEPAVALRGHVDLLRPDDVSERSGISRCPHRKRLPFERTHRHNETRRKDIAGPRARRKHDRWRPAPSLLGSQSGNPPTFELHARDGAMLKQTAAGSHICGAQGRHHKLRIDLVIVDAIEPGRNRRP
jgi:hypothetical protein